MGLILVLVALDLGGENVIGHFSTNTNLELVLILALNHHRVAIIVLQWVSYHVLCLVRISKIVLIAVVRASLCLWRTLDNLNNDRHLVLTFILSKKSFDLRHTLISLNRDNRTWLCSIFLAQLLICL